MGRRDRGTGEAVDPEGWVGLMGTAKVPVWLGPPRPRQGACPIRIVEGLGKTCLIPSECGKVKLAQSSP